jgi:predicted transcriptional regulator
VQIDEHIPSIRSWDNGMYEIINVIKHLEKNNWRTVEITEEVSISEQQVRIHLKSLDKLGYITKETEGRGYTWYNDCMSDIGTYGNVDFDHS